METLHVFRQFLRKARHSEIQMWSAALAFHTLLSIVPVVGLTFLYLRAIGVSRDWYNLTRLFLLSHLNVTEDSLLLSAFDRLVSGMQVRGWGWVGVLIVSYTAWNLFRKFGEIMDAILEIRHEPHEIEKRGHLGHNFRRLVVMLLFPIGLTTSLVITQWIRENSWVHFVLGMRTVGPIAAFPLAWGVDIVALFLIYYFVPRIRVPFHQAAKAALIAGPSIELIKFGFGHWAGHMVAIHRIYGVFFFIPLLILWVQVAWMAVLAAAFFIRVSHRSPAQ